MSDARGVLLVAALQATGCTSCVAAGTVVSTPGGGVDVAQLSAGDSVYSWDVETSRAVSTVIQGVTQADQVCFKIVCGGRELVVTETHPLWCPRDQAYVEAREWIRGERMELLFVENGTSVVREVEQVLEAGVRRVYDLEVKGALANFIAAGILVHNKKQSRNDDCVGSSASSGEDETSSDGETSETGETGETGSDQSVNDASELSHAAHESAPCDAPAVVEAAAATENWARQLRTR